MTTNYIRSATTAEKAKRRATILGSVMVGLVLTAAVTVTAVMLSINLPNKNTEPEIPVQVPVAFAMPIEGTFGILKEFSATELQYNQTMNMWMAHKAVALEAEVGTNVLATYAGTVTKVENHASYGTQVTLEHANGLKTVYSGLSQTVNVSSGDRVEKGQKIGTVGHTITIEEQDPPHIRIEVYRDGIKVNPADYIDFADK